MNANFKQKAILLLLIITLITLPWLGGLIKWGGLPPGFSLLAEKVMDPPGFSLPIFVFLTCVAILLWSFVLFPRWFGFKPPTRQSKSKPTTKPAWPIWSKIGAVVGGLSWIVMWGQFDSLGMVKHLTFVPLWWGYILFLDGIVYRRNQGVSFISSRPYLLFLCAIQSIFGWYYFEYLNFFVMQNWYYPYLDLLPSPQTYIWSAITFSTVWPSVFIWYQLLQTIPAIGLRYAQGPKVTLSRQALWAILLNGLVISVITSIWYDLLFWMIWLGPLLVSATILALSGIWTPLHPIAQGDWRPVMLIAIATTCNSLTWEMWNFWSAPNNPNFWHYDLPYVHQLLVFEMPVLGFTGYLFFGVICWLFWIVGARLFGFSPDVELKVELKVELGTELPMTNAKPESDHE